MKEEWEVSILLALFCLFLRENSPQGKEDTEVKTMKRYSDKRLVLNKLWVLLPLCENENKSIDMIKR
jgi:hypothetical protein